MSWTDPNDGTTHWDRNHEYNVTVHVTFDYTVTVGNPDDTDAIEEAICDILYSDVDFDWDVTDIEDMGEAWYD